MKLAAIYNVWDGLEHLDKSISLIYPYLDHVILVWQTKSNFGEVNPDTSICVQVLATKYPKVTHIYYEPDNGGGTQNEKNKRLIGIGKAKQLGCTHFMHIDTDEYYIPSEFRQGKQFVIDNNLDTSYCRLVTYFKEPTYRLDPLEGYYITFINKISSGGINGYPMNVDPTRGASPAGKYMEVPIKMHHMSYVRNDIGMKLRNSSARVNWLKDIDNRIKMFEDWKFGDKHPFMDYKIVETENLFAE